MCGIFGYLLARSPEGELPSLDKAVQKLRHRGPDGDGTFRAVAGDVACGLAHTRLAIIDLSPSGKQPMSTLDGRLTIVFNGEIYNYRDVRAELEAADDRFVSGSDTEVILLAYARWGSDCLRRFRGMYAFAIWDARERSLFLGRDPMGVKPLYVARVQDGVVFASEVRALLSSGRVARRLDPEGLAGYLAFGSVREPQTIVRGIELLEAGSFAELRDGRWRVGKHWSAPLWVDRSISRKDAIDETRSLLRESIALRLIADVPIGIFLSGGMDSSAIVALASQVSTRPIHTFTVTFDEAAYDEGPQALSLARAFGAEHHVVRLSSKRALDAIDDAVAALDQPSADGTNTYFVAQAVRGAGLAVALSGIGGDEIFAGYAYFRRFRAVMRARRLLGRIPQGVSRLPRGLGLSTPFRKTLGLLGSAGDPFGVYAVLRGVFVGAQRRALLGEHADGGDAPLPGDVAASEWARSAGGDAIAAFGLLDATNYLRNTLLRDTDVMGMAHALEVREPLLDHRLVERLFTLPGSMKLARGVNKPLLAEAVPELPKATSRRKKMGFTLPLAAWLRGPLREWAEDRLPGASALGLDAAAVTQVWRGFLDGRAPFSHVWTLIALADWCRREGVSA